MTKDLDITIKLKEITYKSTKIKVNARNGIIKDKATDLEIIHQTEEVAQEHSSKRSLRGRLHNITGPNLLKPPLYHASILSFHST